ncbi:MAG: flavodoxin domain-containing protein [Anaerovoracaceae bacterium]
MKTLIVYGSKTGTTEKCASILQDLLQDTEVFDLENGNPSLEAYDYIVIGGSVRMGKIHKAVLRFVENNLTVLLKKKVGLFLCNSNIEETRAVFERNYPERLLEHALITTSFGGELDMRKQKGKDKLIVKMVMKSAEMSRQFVSEIRMEAIEYFARTLEEDSEK